MFLKRNIYRLYCRFRSIILSCANEYEISKIKYVGNPPRFAEGCVLHGKEFYELGSGCAFGKNSWVSCIAEYNGQKFSPKLKIGNNFSMAENCHIACISNIEIGDNVLLGSKVFITDHFHGAITHDDLLLPPPCRPLTGNPVKIGNNVWIGEGVCIMPGITIGDNVIVGANAVVTHDCPTNAVVAGCPARVIKNL